MKKFGKILASALLVGSLLTPTFASAKGFLGGSHSSFSSHSSSVSRSTSSFSSRSSSKSSGFSWSRSSSKSSTSKVSLAKSPSKTYSTGYKRSTIATGRAYTSKSTRVYVNHHYVSVNHYYHAGYSPVGWFHYYNGFTTGMFMGSLMHPYGYAAQPVDSAQYVQYGPSPIAWIIDGIVALFFIGMLFWVLRKIL